MTSVAAHGKKQNVGVNSLLYLKDLWCVVLQNCPQELSLFHSPYQQMMLFYFLQTILVELTILPPPWPVSFQTFLLHSAKQRLWVQGWWAPIWSDLSSLESCSPFTKCNQVPLKSVSDLSSCVYSCMTDAFEICYRFRSEDLWLCLTPWRL